MQTTPLAFSLRIVRRGCTVQLVAIDRASGERFTVEGLAGNEDQIAAQLAKRLQMTQSAQPQ